MKDGRAHMAKIVILGAGNVGSTIAYTLAVDGFASELVLIDINKEKAEGEAMDIAQGAAFCPPVSIYSGDYESARGADIVIVTLGMARKPGQTRIDLAQANVNIIKSVMPQIAEIAPNAVYIVVSNPVDILTYAILKCTKLSEKQVFGSGTILDSARLRSSLSEHVGLNAQNVHAYVLGEHGDTSVVAWSLTTIGGLNMDDYCTRFCENHNMCGKKDLVDIENDVRTSGAKVIRMKGATYYAIALSTRKICESVLRNANAVMTVSGMINGLYGINDVCLSVPFVINAKGLSYPITPPLTEKEKIQLNASADSLKEVIASLDI